MKSLFITLVFTFLLMGCGGEERPARSIQAQMAKQTSRPDLPSFTTVGKAFRSVSNGEVNVLVYREGQVKLANQVVPVRLSGYGIRQKSFFFGSVEVAIVQSYFDSSVPVNAGNPLDTVSRSRAKVIIMDFVHDVSSSQAQEATLNAMRINGLNSNTPVFRLVLEKMNGDLYVGDRVLVTCISRPDGSDAISVLTPNLYEGTSGRGIGSLVWRLWFGNTADDDVEGLKQALLGR